MTRPKRLSATFVKTVKEPGRYGDGRGGHGLRLLIKPMSAGGFSKTFSQRLRMNGKPFDIGLGGYPLVSLAEARAKALENARAVKAGIDVRAERKRQDQAVPVFADAAEIVIGIQAKTWKPGSKTEKLWRSRLTTYAYPVIGSMPVSEIASTDIHKVLVALSDKRETQAKLRQYLTVVVDWSISQGFRGEDDNPVAAAVRGLPKRERVRRQHHRALAFTDVSGALARIRESEAYEVTKLAIEFLTLTATRSGEVRGATWGEIDGNIWTIPSARMKSGREHRIPLSDRAMGILEDAKYYADDSELLFPSVRGKQLSDNTLSKLFRDLLIGGTPHGLRSSFRDWAAERTDYPREICEFALAHIEGSAAELAYRRTDYFDNRCELMQDWADFLVVGSYP